MIKIERWVRWVNGKNVYKENNVSKYGISEKFVRTALEKTDENGIVKDGYRKGWNKKYKIYTSMDVLKKKGAHKKSTKSNCVCERSKQSYLCHLTWIWKSCRTYIYKVGIKYGWVLKYIFGKL